LNRAALRTAYAALLAIVIIAGLLGTAHADLRSDFRQPPDSARPWVFWFWNNGNITREGLTADLEAMKRVGIGGVLIMEVSVGAPDGPVPFMGDTWRELFKHMVSEADRLGIVVNMNNDAGWTGSAGPWIKPEQSMKKLVSSEVTVDGPARFDQVLPHPETAYELYREVGVLAFPAPSGDHRIKNIDLKASRVAGYLTPDAPADSVPAGQVIDGKRIVDLTAKMTADGRLTWDVPAGKWTIMRFGYTSSGNHNGPAPAHGDGLECDKLSKEGIQAQWDGMIGKLVADVGPLAGKTLAMTHVDSWEVGPQNWTDRMPEEFARRRGYDMRRYLPVFSGRAIDSGEVSERFLWDVRQTISELLIENYTGHLRTIANRHGMKLSLEAYGGPCDELAYSGSSDEPTCEFWIPNGYQPYPNSAKQMSSGAHIYGKSIVGAEAFTAMSDERWQQYPGKMKPAGDLAFCDGVNKFIFHRFAHQPWLNVSPGMSMGPYGVHYERTQTWWEQTSAWHTYLARCQYMLRQGKFVADVCYLQAESAPQSTVLHKGEGYDYDVCTPDIVLKSMNVANGRLVLKSGMSYAAMVLPEARTMTPALLSRIKSLIEAGATVIGAPPLRSPSLADYPECDREIWRLVREIWDNCDGKAVKQRKLGKGRIVRGMTPSEVLKGTGLAADFTAGSDIRFIHRRAGDTDIYFLANAAGQTETDCTFRVKGKQPEFWRADSGQTQPVVRYSQKSGLTTIPVRLEAGGSVFVVFRPGKGSVARRVTGVLANGKPIESAPGATAPKGGSEISIAFWAKPKTQIELPNESIEGTYGTGTKRNDVVFPQQGEIAFGPGHAAVGVSVGTNGVCVYEHSASYLPSVLVYPASITDWTHIAVVYSKNLPTLYVNGKSVHQGLRSPKILHCGISADDARYAGSFAGAFASIREFGRSISEAELTELMESTRKTTADDSGIAETPDDLPAIDLDRREIWAAGNYSIALSNAKTVKIDASSIPDPMAIRGPWSVSLPQASGETRITLDSPASLSGNSDPAVKYFSGTATYSTSFTLPASAISASNRLYLDLGRVEVSASVKLNGRDLGIAWKRPYRVEITGAAKSGENTLEVQVATTWINRMIGDEFLPEDSVRNNEGNITEWPKWLIEGKPSPTGRATFTTWRLWKKDDPLTPSGLIGPVKVLVSRVFDW